MKWTIVFPVLAAFFAVGSGGLVGGLQDADINDEGVRNILNFAVVQHNRGRNDLYLSQVAEVIKVQRQVVGGINYYITVKMAKTPCRKDSANEVCAIYDDVERAQPYQCVFTVWSRPWEGMVKLTKEKC